MPKSICKIVLKYRSLFCCQWNFIWTWLCCADCLRASLCLKQRPESWPHKLQLKHKQVVPALWMDFLHRILLHPHCCIRIAWLTHGPTQISFKHILNRVDLFLAFSSSNILLNIFRFFFSLGLHQLLSHHLPKSACAKNIPYEMFRYLFFFLSDAVVLF